MNKHIWSGIITWGIFATCFGLGALNPTNIAAAAPAQEVIFLLAGGIVTFLVGVVGLLGSIGWVPDLANSLAPKRSIYRLGRG